MNDYLCWYVHEELFVRNKSMVERMVGLTSSASNVHRVTNDNNNPYKNMVMDAMRMNQGNASQCLLVEEEPNTDVTKFFFIF
jgi:V8-like Glu-specific endopeptidase